MKINITMLICFISIFANSLLAGVNSHIQPYSYNSKIDTSLQGNLALDIVRVSDIGNCSNLLEWITKTEVNCYSFAIMKSTDNINFTSLGSVLGNGTTTEPKQYDFVDNHASPNNYYRIDQFDTKGNMMSSAVLIATSTCGNAKAETVIEEIYPNSLLENELEIRVYQNSVAQKKVQLTDQFGKVIIEKNVKLKQGKNILRLNVNRISSGTYFIKVGTASQKFAK